MTDREWKGEGDALSRNLQPWMKLSSTVEHNQVKMLRT